MSQTRRDVDRTIPKQVDESDNSSGNGESIKSIASDSLSLNLISGNGEHSRDDSIPTDDSHISTDRHRYYIREVTVTGHDQASIHQEVTVTGQDLASSHQMVTDNDNLDGQGEDEVVDSDINPDTSPNPHIHSWLRGLNNSSDGPFQVTRGTQYTAEDDPPSQHRRQDRTSTASYCSPAGHTHAVVTSNGTDKNFMNGVCLCLTLVYMLYGVGSVNPRLNQLENQMMQSQVTRCQIQDAMKHQEQNPDQRMPGHINQPMPDFTRSSNSVFWEIFLFGIISIVALNALYNFTGDGFIRFCPFPKQNILSLSYYPHKNLGHKFARMEEEINDLLMHGSGLKDVLDVIVRNVGAQDSQLVKICEQMDKLEHGLDQTNECITALNTKTKESAKCTQVTNAYVKTLFQSEEKLKRHLKQIDSTCESKIEDIESGCKQMKAAILGLFMSLTPQIDKFVTKYDKTEESVVLDVVPMMGLAWCADQTNFRRDSSNEFCSKANLIPTSEPHSGPKMKYEIRVAIMKCMTGSYKTEMIQAICSHCRMLRAVLNDSEGRYALCRAIESPDMSDDIFTGLSYIMYELGINSLPEPVIESFLNRLNEENTFAFHLIYILLGVMKDKNVGHTTQRNISSKLREQLKNKTCTGLKTDHSGHVDECLTLLGSPFLNCSPEVLHCTALLLWSLQQSDGFWVEYMKGNNSFRYLTYMACKVTNAAVATDTKQIIMQILRNCGLRNYGIVLCTNNGGSAMPPKKLSNKSILLD